MAEIVINVCFGGFSLSPRAVKRMAELQGRECYFFTTDFAEKATRYQPADPDALRPSIFLTAFDIPNPNEVLVGSNTENWHAMSTEERQAANELYGRHCITSRPDDRADPLLVQVVKELGEEANGSHAKLRVVEVPDGVEWEIDEYDGNEHVAEKHRTWA